MTRWHGNNDSDRVAGVCVADRPRGVGLPQAASDLAVGVGGAKRDSLHRAPDRYTRNRSLRARARARSAAARFGSTPRAAAQRGDQASPVSPTSGIGSSTNDTETTAPPSFSVTSIVPMGDSRRPRCDAFMTSPLSLSKPPLFETESSMERNDCIAGLSPVGTRAEHRRGRKPRVRAQVGNVQLHSTRRSLETSCRRRSIIYNRDLSERYGGRMGKATRLIVLLMATGFCLGATEEKRLTANEKLADGEPAPRRPRELRRSNAIRSRKSQLTASWPPSPISPPSVDHNGWRHSTTHGEEQAIAWVEERLKQMGFLTRSAASNSSDSASEPISGIEFHRTRGSSAGRQQLDRGARRRPSPGTVIEWTSH